MDAVGENEQTQPPIAPGDRQQESDLDLLALLQRERADFLNYRRRIGQERVEENERARAGVLTEILPLLDELDRATSQTPPDLAASPWAQGVLLIRNRLRDVLNRLGVEPLGAEGDPFDPTIHQALFYEQQPGIAEQQVATVIRPGFRMGQRVLRPAEVAVVGPADDGAPPRDDEPAAGSAT
jgi:molecular chaperone GrpE